MPASSTGSGPAVDNGPGPSRRVPATPQEIERTDSGPLISNSDPGRAIAAPPPPRPSEALNFIRQASTRRLMRQESALVRDSAAEQLEERQSDWAYSRPVVLLDLMWNAAFIICVIVILCVSQDEAPSAPLRIWLVGYAAQCAVHMVCVGLEYLRREKFRQALLARSRRRGASGGGGGGRGGGAELRGAGRSLSTSEGASERMSSLTEGLLEEEGRSRSVGAETATGDDTVVPRLGGSIARKVESVNSMLSLVWWALGFAWLLSTFDDTFQDSPLLSWLCMVFLAFDVFFVVFCTALACVIGIAVCCCLPCIIALLYAVGQQDGASQEDIDALPRFKFHTKLAEPGAGGTSEAECAGPEGSAATATANPGSSALSSRASAMERGDSTGRGGVMVALDKASEVKEQVVAAGNAECCICLSPYEDGATLRALRCNHHFHLHCVDKWLRTKPTCPLCKTNISSTRQSAVPSQAATGVPSAATAIPLQSESAVSTSGVQPQSASETSGSERDRDLEAGPRADSPGEASRSIRSATERADSAVTRSVSSALAPFLGGFFSSRRSG